MEPPSGNAPLLSVAVTAGAATTTIFVVGEIDAASADELARALKDASQSGPTHILVNMEGVSFIDSSGLGVLIRGYKAVTAAGGRLTIGPMSPPVERLLQITGQHDRFAPPPA